MQFCLPLDLDIARCFACINVHALSPAADYDNNVFLCAESFVLFFLSHTKSSVKFSTVSLSAVAKTKQCFVGRSNKLVDYG